MKNVNQIGKRFLALLLAVVMIVGQIPFGAVAEEPGEGTDPAPFQNVEFQAKLTRTTVREEKTEEVDGAPQTTPAAYTYAVSVQTSTAGAEYADAASEDYTVTFVFSDEKYNADDVTVSTEDALVKAKISYKGRVLIVSASETYTKWEPSIAWSNDKVTVKDTVSVEAPNPTGTSGWDAAYSWNQTAGKAVSNLFTADAADLNSPEKVLVAEYRLQNDSSETIFAVQYYTTVDYADVDAESVEIKADMEPDASGWYITAPQYVTITATADAKYSKEEIRPVSGGTWELAEAQTVADKISLVNKLTVNETSTISLAGKELQMKIDTSAPEIGYVTAYKDASNNVNVAAKVTASSSGIASVKVGETDLTLNGDIYTGTFTGVDSITVVATGNNGLKSEETVAVAPDLAFGTWSVSGEAGKYYETEQKVYIAADTSVSLSVNVNTEQANVTATGANLSGDTSTTVTYTTNSAAAANTYKASATDYRGTKETTFPKEIVVDNAAPTWNPEVNETKKATVDTKLYYGAEKLVYSLNLSDDASGVASFTGSYKINGGEPVAINAQTIEVQAGQTLSDVQITVTDNCGNSTTYSDPNAYVVDNKKPVLEYEIDDTYVSNIVKTEEGIYLILKDEYKYQSANSPEEITINATATLTEDNMAAEAVNGWTKTGNQYTKQFDVTVTKGSTNLLKLEAPVFEDLVGLKIASTTNVRVENSSNVVNVNGTVAEVKVDRRPPSSDETENIKVPELIFNVDAGLPKSTNGNVLFGKNFEITFTVYDGGTYNSGVNSVKWHIDSAAGVQLTGTTEAAAAGTYTAVGTVDANVENQNVVLTVEAGDKAGNAFIYTYNFAVDTQAPRIAFNPASVDEWNNGEVTVEVTVTDMNISSTEGDLTIDMVGGDAEDYTIVPNTEIPGKYTITFRDSDITDKAHVEFKLSATSIDLCGNTPAPSALNAFKIYQGESAVDVTVNGTAKVENLNGTYYYEADQVTITAVVYDSVEHIASATMTYKLDTESEKTVPITETIVVPDQAVLEYLQINVTNVAGTTTSAVSGADWLFDGDTKSDVKIAVDNQAPQFSIERTVEENTGYVQSKDDVDYFNGEVNYTFTVTDKFLSKNAEDIVIKVNGSDENLNKTVENGKVTLTLKVDDQSPLQGVEILVKDIVGKSAVVTSFKDDENIDKSSDFANLNEMNPLENCLLKTSDTIVYVDEIIVDQKNPVVTAEIKAFGEDGEDAEYQIEKFFSNGDKYFAYITPEEESGFNFLQDNTEDDKVYVELTFTLNESNPDADRLSANRENGWKLDEGTWTYTVTKEVLKENSDVLEFSVPVVDMAGNYPTEELIITSGAKETKSGTYSNVYVLNATTEKPENDTTYGVYNGVLYLDRKTPDVTPNGTFDGEIQLDTSVKPVAVLDGVELYNSDFAFELKIDDADSGIDLIGWDLIGEEVGKNIVDSSKEKFTADADEYVIDVDLTEAAFETEEVKLKVNVVDHVGNAFTYVRNFSVDHKNPQIQVSKTNDAHYIQTIEGVDYYDDVVSYNIAASDMFMQSGFLTYVIDGKATTVEVNGDTFEHNFTVRSNQELSDIELQFLDYAGHYALRKDLAIDENNNTKFIDFIDTKDNKIQLSTNHVVVDMDAPEFDVEISSEDIDPVVGENGVTYYQKPVEIQVTVTDEFLTNMYVENQAQSLELTYTKESGSESITLPASENGWSVNLNETVYTTTVEVKSGEVLTGMKLVAYDNAHNPIKAVPVDLADVFALSNDVVSYIGNTIVVDDTSAKIEVVKEVADGGFVQEFEGNDYYKSEVTYKFKITDAFMNLIEGTPAQAKVYVTYQGKTEPVEIDLLKEADKIAPHSNTDTMEGKFTVVNGEAVTGMKLVVIDNAGNISTHQDIKFTDADNRTSFETVRNTDEIAFTGMPFIVDMTAPTATLKIDGNATQYYTNKDGVLFVRLVPAAEGDSGSFVEPADYQTVELILTVSDKNLTLAKNDWAVVSNNDANGAWNSDIHVNADSTVTYTKTINVKTDEVGVITMDMSVFDLASNALSIKGIEYLPLNNTIVENPAAHIKFSELEAGRFVTKVSADRRRVSSLDDNLAPVIKIDPAASDIKTNDGIDLFNSDVEIKLNVTDGAANDQNSGIAYVEWSIKDEGANPCVDNKDGRFNGTQIINGVLNEVHSMDQLMIPVDINGTGESNKVFVTITAVDNVGNSTTFQKQIAMDNLDPRIKVTYENNDVRNEKYFKADRVANISITDINLDPEQYAVVDTTGTASGWTYDNTVATSSVSFTVEGEHKFNISCKDRAGNESLDADVQYTGEAVHEFILDKTRPVITVTFNPSTPSGRDEAGVNYYDQEQNVTVSVRDEYFDSGVVGSVNANMGAGFNLGGFYKNGSNHTASVRYTEGNNYSFNVTVTDLAGNVSDTYNSETFSVDLTSPTIVISSGNLTNEELNIVQDDLVLGFTINDAQNNLSGYTVKLTHLNNEFKETVVEGAEYYVVNDVNDRTTVYVNFDSIEAIKENDGTYNVQITATDYAGHIVSLNPSLNFSLNRFGSTFMTDDEFTANFLEPSSDGNVYQNSVSNKLVIKEINPNKVWQDDSKTTQGSVITIAVNGQSIILEKDVDYTVTLSEEGTGSNKWYVYTYEIDPANFLDGEELVDGNYTVLLYGIDEAGNKNTNESNEYGSVQKDAEGEYSGKITFTLDHKAPVITTYGFTEKVSENEYEQIIINLSDNTPASVKVLVNGVEVVLSETMEGLANNQLWLAQNPKTGEYVLNIPESNEKRSVTIVTTDAAGNVSEQVIEDVLITSNAFIRAINNPVIVGSVGVGTVGLIALIIFLLKKKKNKEEQPA